jgi:multiple sugar transport system ATP-binding protein
MNFFQGSVRGDDTPLFHQEGSDFAIGITADLARRISARPGTPIIMGVRPEHMFVRAPAATSSVAPFQARIEVVEPVGNEIFVYFTTGAGGTFVARIAADNPPAVGSTRELYLDTSKVHFFDCETEKTL